MSSFILPDWIDACPGVEVTIPPNVTKDQLLAFRPFKNWLSTLRQSITKQQRRFQQQRWRPSNNERHALDAPPNDYDLPYQLHRINVRSVEWAGPRILFVLLHTVVQSATDERALPGIVFLRGGSVAILMIVRPEDDPAARFVVMTHQPRVPAGSFAFREIPAGMIDDEDAFVGAAATEIREETGLIVRRDELVDMTELAVRRGRDDWDDQQHLQRAVYPSPGGCDEFVALFLWQQVMPRPEIERLRGKLTGNRTDGEKIQVGLVEYKDLWREGARDAKTLAACALYENLVREGVLLG
jgi:8-oxo-dGTP pyrophosphatase MutT (NUDIX family)